MIRQEESCDQAGEESFDLAREESYDLAMAIEESYDEARE